MIKLVVSFEENIKVVDMDTMEVVHITTDTNDLMKYLLKGKNNKEVYIHDLAHDGAFLPYYLKDNGYSSIPLDSNKTKLLPKTFQKLVSEKGLTYMYRIKKNSKYGIKIFDSSKLFVQDIDTISDKVFKGSVEQHMIIPILLNKLHSEGHTKMTIGANAFNEFLRIRFNNNWLKFKDTFPSVKEDVEEFIRNAYRGGWVYANEDYVGNKTHTINGLALDVNSLFPSVMKDCWLPYGEPKAFEGKYKAVKSFPLYLQKIKIRGFNLKDNKVPMIPKGEMSKEESGYLSYSYEILDAPKILTLTNVELELLLDSYDIDKIEYLGGYMFRPCVGMFDEYIDKFYDLKRNATNEIDRLLAKLFLNNLYGKFGTQFIRQGTDISFNEETGLEERITLSKQYKSRQYYTAMSVFITSYARCITIKGANANYDNFLYADTDSLHLKGDIEDVKELVIHNSNLGEWKVERYFDKIKILGLKKYMEHDINTDEWKIVIAGLPDEAKATIKSPDELVYNKPIPILMKEKVVGGYVTVERVFTIKNTERQTFEDYLYDDFDEEDLIS